MSREPKETVAPPAEKAAPAPFWTRPRLIIAVGALLALHTTLAVSSLVRENPTVDEVAHMPAGVSYWQTGSFKLYHHNPPLVKLLAALPVVMAGPETAELYKRPSWTSKFPDHSTFAYQFALLNADRYFELFTTARLLMPLFSVVGGLVIFLWAKQLYGFSGGFLSLALWVLCPNVLAHARLVTTDVGATALGVAATYLFWRYLEAPSWRRVIWAGVVLGLAELAKFSMLLLYGLWPLLWLIHELGKHPRMGWPRRWLRAAEQGAAIVAISVLVINIGYGFEGTGLPLGSPELEFGCKTLTRPIPPGRVRPISPNPLFNGAWKERENRFRKTWLAAIPAPLPKQYLLGFDEQKLESEGVPGRWLDSSRGDEIVGYPVYLDGQLRQTGWRSYYFWAAMYKVPEGTWILVVLATAVLFLAPRSRAAWPDELILLLVPLTIVVSMSVLTDINLGLRYVLPIFPYLFIAAGKLARWVATLESPLARMLAASLVAGSVALTAAATLTIHPHYLAYFNWASGGPRHGSDHLIDSNLDWGQDLVNLREWAETNAPGEPIGLAYFGQINPTMFRQLRGEPFDWFLAPGKPGSITPRVTSAKMSGPPEELKPGLYAVSVTLLRGLPWRLYDPNLLAPPQAWSAARYAYSDFLQFSPIARIGESIFVYRLSEADCARLRAQWGQAAPAQN